MRTLVLTLLGFSLRYKLQCLGSDSDPQLRLLAQKFEIIAHNIAKEYDVNLEFISELQIPRVSELDMINYLIEHQKHLESDLGNELLRIIKLVKNTRECLV